MYTTWPSLWKMFERAETSFDRQLLLMQNSTIYKIQRCIRCFGKLKKVTDYEIGS